jgi:hypothetical protein
VNFLNIGSRETALNATSSPLRSAFQSFANSFNSRVSTPFGTTLQELEASQPANQAAVFNSVARQNLVATLSNSRATEENASGLAAVFGNGIATAATVSNSTSRATSSGGSGSASSTSTVQPAAPPTPYATAQANSTDPTTYGTMDYSEAMNLSGNEVQANDENGRRYANYLNEFSNWQMNGSQGQPPQPPVYETVDQNGFDKWWAEYQQNMTAGDYQPPDNSMFLINGPDYGNGYYGATGTTEVGTLYNPTGPATADQVQNANKPSGTNS